MKQKSVNKSEVFVISKKRFPSNHRGIVYKISLGTLELWLLLLLVLKDEK